MPKINTCSDLSEDIVKSLKVGGVACIDAEFTGLSIPTHDRLSLVQICGKDSKEIYLIQPNKKYETPNLVKVLEDPNIQVIGHFLRADKKALEYFLRPKLKIKNIFDTKLASRLVRRYDSEHGLARLCQEFCGVKLDKKMASSDWEKPISDFSEKEKSYAAADVQYLFSIKTKLEVMLKREKRYEIFLKCMEFLDTRIEMDNQGFENIKIFDH